MTRFELREAISGFWAHWAAWALLAVAFAAAGAINVFLAVSAHEWWPAGVAVLAFVSALVGAWMAVVASRAR
ncbi:MAG TPA: hypothetical protein VFM37_08485 [Pseudonocardiaceae bacterium]|nr:hypothetical protein [Pseudonocardiaceae bacterium]